MSDLPKSLDSAIKKEVGIGDNSSLVPEDFRIVVTPPEDIPPYLAKEYAPIASRYAELMASAAAMPDTIENDIESGKAGDLTKELRLWDDRADSARTIEKEPFQKGGSTIDAWFKNMMKPAEGAKKRILAANTAYLNKKKDEAMRELERKAKEKRDAEEAARVEAAKAEERRVAAEEAQRVADAAAAEARENKDELEQERLDCETALAQAKLRRAKARRDRDEPAFVQGNADVTAAEEALKAAKEKLRAAREAQRIALADAEKKASETRKTTAAAASASDTAVREGKAADKLERKIETVTDGELVQTRGDHGSVNTLARNWQMEIIDMKLVHENASMWLGLIDPDAIRVAIGKRMRAGNRDVPGVKYEQVSDGRSI